MISQTGDTLRNDTESKIPRNSLFLFCLCANFKSYTPHNHLEIGTDDRRALVAGHVVLILNSNLSIISHLSPEQKKKKKRF